ncbi:MAG TPA: hypothetical protein VK425_10140 [Acidimicrobiales bacterium]|nr:hypothetical protein [Acidimicrobiales bacterium]
MAVCDVVVIGSYPPMPGPATAATLAAVRRVWDEGCTVRVVSFRPGAADISVPVAGPLAGWRLEQIRRHYGQPPAVVLVLQAGVPFIDHRYPAQLATAGGLAVALRRFPRSTVVVGEDPRISPASFRALVRAAGEVIVDSETMAAALAERYNLQLGAFSVVELEPYPPLPPGAELGTGGLYRPRAARGLTLVEMPTTTLAERVRARGRLSRAALLRRLRGR